MLVSLNALCKPSLGAPSYVTKILQAENGQKVDKVEQICLRNYRYWWKMVRDFWIHYQQTLLWLSSFTPTWKLFFLFCSFFLFLLPLSTFKRLNALYSKFEHWRYQGGLLLDWNRGFNLGYLPQSGPPKFKLFNLLNWTHENFKVSKCQKKKNLTKFGSTEIGRSPSNRASKIQNF